MTDRSDKPLHVIQLKAENFKRLKAVQIEPKGHMVQITGLNAMGKSSVLDALWSTLGGASQIPTEPIRQGTQKAKVQVDLGELLVTRTFTPKGTTLTVEDPHGKIYKSPQTLLDGLMGALTFDPLAFTRKKPAEQTKELCKVAKIAIDLDLIDKQIQDLSESREHLKKEALAARAGSDGITILPYGDPIDKKPLLDKMQSLYQEIKEYQEKKSAKQKLEEDIALQEERIKRAEEAIQTSITWLAFARPKLEVFDIGTAPIDPAEIRRLIDEADVKNSFINSQKHRQTRKEELIEQEQVYLRQIEKTQEEIQAKMKAKEKALEEAEMPLPGLGFENGIITYGGVPFSQASSAEKLRISTAIAMAGNPRLRVIRISDGSLLDEDNLAMIAEMAQKGDYQIWIECVDSTGQVGICIEDGEVVADNQENSEPSVPDWPDFEPVKGNVMILENDLVDTALPPPPTDEDSF